MTDLSIKTALQQTCQCYFVLRYRELGLICLHDTHPHYGLQFGVVNHCEKLLDRKSNDNFGMGRVLASRELKQHHLAVTQNLAGETT